MLRLVSTTVPGESPTEATPGEGTQTMLTLTTPARAYLTERQTTGSYSAKSIAAVRYRLHSLARSHGARPLTQLRRRAILRWLESLAGLAPATRAAYLASASGLCAWMVERRLIEANPCEDVDRPRVPKATPRAQTGDAVAAVLAACSTDRERAIVWLMVGSGLRRMEVAHLRWADVDDRAGLLTVRASKNGGERVLPIPAEVLDALRRLPRTWGHVIAPERRYRDRAVTPQRISYIVADIMRRAGVKRHAGDGVSAHALRHTAASDVLDTCGDLRVVQQMLGHQQLSSTSIYLRRANAHQMRTAMEGRTYDRGGDHDRTAEPESGNERRRAA